MAVTAQPAAAEEIDAPHALQELIHGASESGNEAKRNPGTTAARSQTVSDAGERGNTGYAPWYFYVQGVNLANGNLYRSQEDLSIDARGGSITLSRVYNSHLSARHGPFGFGWTHNYDLHLTPQTDGSVDLFDADGSVHTFTPNGSGFDAPAGVHTQLRVNGSGYDLRYTTGNVQYFDASGRLIRVTDPNGNAVHLDYTGDQLTRIHDDSGLGLDLSYDPNGRIVEVTDPIGRNVTYGYRTGDLVNVTDVMDDRTEYGYFENHKLNRITHPSGLTTIYGYNSSTDRVHCVASGRSSVSCESSGIAFDYDYPNDTVSVGRTLTGNVTRVELDDSGSPVTVIAPSGVGHFAWDDDRNRIRMTNTSGTYQFDYDDFGNLIERTDPQGATVRYGYRTIETPSRYQSLRVSETDPLGRTWTYEYDHRGNRIRETNPTGATREFDYDRFGLLRNVTAFDGGTTSYTYDSHGFRTSYTNAAGERATFGTDGIGRRTTLTTPGGQTYTYEYNDRGDVIRLTDPHGNTVRYVYNDNGYPTHAISDAGRFGKARVNEPQPMPNPAEYDVGVDTITMSTDDYTYTRKFENNRLQTATIDYGPFSRSVEYTYDLAGNLLTETVEGQTRRYTYDALDRVSTIEVDNRTAASYTYDAAGRVESVTFGNGVTTQYSYDPAGRATAIQTTHPNGTVLLEYTYTYDENGNRLTATDTTGAVTRYGYDDLSRLVNVSYPSGRTVEYTYGPIGSRLTRTVNGTNTTRYHYDGTGLGRIKVQLFEYSSDGLTRKFKEVTDAATGNTTIVGTTYRYGADGRLANVTFPDGDHVAFTYLPGGERLSKTTANGTTYFLPSRFNVVAAFEADGSLERRYLHGPGADQPVRLTQGGKSYYYHFDGPLNVRALTDPAGDVANRYRYRAFGTTASASETVDNPYRFAGRHYDGETGLYYNRQRYYDPGLGRFIQPDPVGLYGGTNPWIYADNNPLVKRDPTGLDGWTGTIYGGGFMLGFSGMGAWHGTITNKETGQSCEIDIHNFRLGGGLGIQGGAQQIHIFGGPPCGKELDDGVSWSAFIGVASGPAMCEGDVSTGSGSASVGCGVGAAGGLAFSGGVKMVGMLTDHCSCNCDCAPSEHCTYDLTKSICDDDDNGPPGGDHPDDNHDLSVLDYNRRYADLHGSTPTYDYQRDSLAVFARGFDAELRDFLVEYDQPARTVDIGTSQSALNEFDTLIIPSGGLVGLASLTPFAETLEAYVEQGGTLIVLPQPRGYQFAPVPGDLAGYGWQEDQSCQFSSVAIDEFCSVLSSVAEETPSINVDGYFTDYPANSKILLTRTKNAMPAMLTYDYGEGRVLASAAYTDWAYGHHASNEAGRALLRDIVQWGRHAPNSTVYGPGETIRFSTDVVSYVDMPVDRVRVEFVDPDGGVHPVERRVSIDPLANGSVTVDYPLPNAPTLGLWEVEYVLVNDTHGDVQRVQRVGQVGVASFDATDDGWQFEGGNISYSVNSRAERYAYGSNATFTISMHNRDTVEHTVEVAWSYPHHAWETGEPIYGLPGVTVPHPDRQLNATVTIPAGETATVTDEIPVSAPNDRLWATFYRNDTGTREYLGRASRGFFGFYPTVGLDVDTEQERYEAGDRVGINLSVTNSPVESAELAVLIIDPSNRLLDRQTYAVNYTTAGWRLNQTITLPSPARGGTYGVVAEATVGEETVGYDGAHFTVPTPRLAAVPTVPETFDASNRIGLTVRNVGEIPVPNTTTNVSFVDPTGSVIWNDTFKRDVPVDGTVNLSTTLPMSTPALGTYRLEYDLAYGFDRRVNRVRTVANSAGVSINLSRPIYREGETVDGTVHIANDGRFVSNLSVNVSVPVVRNSTVTSVGLAPGENTTIPFAARLPTPFSPGTYAVNATVSSRTSVSETAPVVVPESDLDLGLSTPNPAAGEVIPVNLTNVGGVATNATCTYTLYGPGGVDLASNTSTHPVAAGSTTPLSVPIPDAAVDGAYLLPVECTDGTTGRVTRLTGSFDVSGLDADVASTTDSEVYRSGDNVTVSTTITNHGAAIDNGTLTIRIINASVTTSGPTTLPGGSQPSLQPFVPTTDYGLHSGSLLASSANRIDHGIAADRSRTLGGPSDSGFLQRPPRAQLAEPTTVSTADQTISTPTVWRDEVIDLAGNLTVTTGGNLTLVNTTVAINGSHDGEYHVQVQSGGTFNAQEGSAVRAVDPDTAYTFSVADGATFALRNTTISDIGDSWVPIEEDGLYIETDNVVIENSTFRNNDYGVILDSANHSRLRNVTVIDGSSYGIYVRDSVDVEVTGHGANDATWGVVFLRTNDSRFIDNDLSERATEVRIDQSRNVTIANNSFVDSGYVNVRNARDLTIRDNRLDRFGVIAVDQSRAASVINNDLGQRSTIRLDLSTASTVRGNTVEEIELDRTADLTISDNLLTVTAFSGGGIEDDDGMGNVIRNNTVTDGNTGIYLTNAADTVVAANTLDANANYGLHLEESTNATVSGNTLTSNAVDFFVEGELGNPPGGALKYYLHNVTANQVTAGPLYYLVNETTTSVNSDAGEVWVVNGDDVTVEHGQAVRLIHTRNSIVSGVTVSAGENGVFLYGSDNNRIENSAATGVRYGFRLESSDNNELVGNDVSNPDSQFNAYAIRIWESNGTSVTDTTIDGDWHSGMYLYRAHHGEYRQNSFTTGPYWSFNVQDATDNLLVGNDVRTRVRLSQGGSNVLRANRLRGLIEVRSNSDANEFLDNTIEEPNGGIQMVRAHATLIRNNTVTADRGQIRISSGRSESTRILDNTFEGTLVPVYVDRISPGTVVAGNVLRNGTRGIVIRETENVTIADNDIGGFTEYGIHLFHTRGASIDSNTIANTAWPFEIDVDERDIRLTRGGNALPFYLHNVTRNTIDGKPLHFRTNVSHTTVPSNVAVSWFVNSQNVSVTHGGGTNVVYTSNVSVSGLTASAQHTGIYVRNASNVDIDSVIARNNSIGISLQDVVDASVTDSEAFFNGQGLRVNGAESLGISGVHAHDNERGLFIRAANGSMVATNNASDNVFGLWFQDATNNVVSDNELRRNEIGLRTNISYRSPGFDDNSITANRIVANDRGILLSGAERTVIEGNLIVNQTEEGITLADDYSWTAPNEVARNNLIYNNYIDNPQAKACASCPVENANDYGVDNRWNVSKQRGDNIVGGPFLGGNYWGDYAGNDTNGDALGDTALPYTSSGRIRAGGDYHPLIPSAASGPVVYETSIPVDVAAGATETVDIQVPVAALGGSEGKFKLESELTSSLGQMIAIQDPAFYVIDGDTVVTMETDQAVYFAGETIQLTGEVRNEGSSQRSYTLVVTANGSELLNEPITLDPGESHAYSTTTQSNGPVELAASAGGVTVSDRVTVDAPTVSASIDAPAVAGNDPFDVGLDLENTGAVPVDLDVVLANGSQRSMTLQPGDERRLTTTLRISDNTTVSAAISGDVTRTLNATVRYGLQADVAVTPRAAYPAGPVAIPYTVTNTGELPTSVPITIEVDTRQFSRDVYVPVGGSNTGRVLVDLGEGTYPLTVTSPYGGGNATINVTARNQLGLNGTVTATQTTGALSLAVPVSNLGYNDVHGRLSVRASAFDGGREFNVSGGQQTTVPLTIPLSNATKAGTYNTTLSVESEGVELANRTVPIQLAAPEFAIVDAPNTVAIGIGEQLTVNVTIENVGGVQGLATLESSATGLYDSREEVWVRPGERVNATITFPIPDDLPTGDYALEHAVGNSTAETTLAVRGIELAVDHSLDQPLYTEGETARLSLNVSNDRATSVDLFARVKFNDYDARVPFTLGPNGSDSLAFDVPVAYGGDAKVFYGIYAAGGRSIHLNGVYLHERVSSDIALTMDRQVYESGERASVTVETTTTGPVQLSAPGLSWQETVSAGTPTTVNFTVPPLRSGTYYVHYSFDNETFSYPFDVEGYDIRVLDAAFNETTYDGGDGFAFELTVEPNRAVPVTVESAVLTTAGPTSHDGSIDRTLSAGENTLTISGTFPEEPGGIHAVEYDVLARVGSGPPIPLANGRSFISVETVSTPAPAPPATVTITPRLWFRPPAPLAGNPVRFDGSNSTISNGSITSYTWDFDNDSVIDATGPVATHRFASAGNYTVALTVLSDTGASETVRTNITVRGRPPSAGSGGSPGAGGGARGGGGGGGGGPPDTPPGLTRSIQGSTVTFPTGTVLRISFRQDPGPGRVTVRDLKGLPDDVDPVAPPYRIGPAVDIEVPPGAADTPATVHFEVDRSILGGVDPSVLVVVRWTDTGWEFLPTSVVRSNGVVELAVETPGFSVFAVLVGQPTTTAPTATTAPQTTPTPEMQPDTPVPTTVATPEPDGETATPQAEAGDGAGPDDQPPVPIPIREPGGVNPWLLLVAGVALAVLGVLSLYWRRRR